MEMAAGKVVGGGWKWLVPLCFILPKTGIKTKTPSSVSPLFCILKDRNSQELFRLISQVMPFSWVQD